ncbi:MAG: hypothetical protein KBS53_00610 [Bacteroidales bacterium]|nr:hypothetical protein [Candidatus Hennigimonas equi]
MPVLVLALMSFPVSAEEDGAVKFRERINGKRVDMILSWSAKSSGKTYMGDGRLSWKDGRFVFANDDVQIYNDGKSLTSVSQAGREVVVQPSDNTDFLSEPAALASLLGLNPAKAGIVMHYGGNGDLSGADITLKNGTSVSVRVESMTVGGPSEDGDFAFDVESLDSSWVVTDLR